MCVGGDRECVCVGEEIGRIRRHDMKDTIIKKGVV